MQEVAQTVRFVANNADSCTSSETMKANNYVAGLSMLNAKALRKRFYQFQLTAALTGRTVINAIGFFIRKWLTLTIIKCQTSQTLTLKPFILDFYPFL